MTAPLDKGTFCWDAVRSCWSRALGSSITTTTIRAREMWAGQASPWEQAVVWCKGCWFKSCGLKSSLKHWNNFCSRKVLRKASSTWSVMRPQTQPCTVKAPVISKEPHTQFAITHHSSHQAFYPRTDLCSSRLVMLVPYSLSHQYSQKAYENKI